MSKWNNSLVLVLLVYLARGRSIELSFKKGSAVSYDQHKDKSIPHVQVGCDLQEVYPLEVYYCEPRSKNQNNAEKEIKSTVAIGVQCAFKVNDSSISIIKECNAHGWHDTEIYNAVLVARDTVVSSHGERVKRFLLRLIGRIEGVASLFCCHHANRDRTSPSIACPYVEPKLADQIQTNRIMNWKEPMAHDNKDGTFTPQRGGPGPGVLFNEGSTYVKYYARDRAGNHNTCIVKVTVKVVRCPAISPMRNGYYICHPSDDLVQGATCHFGCYRGHKLSGYQTTECIGTIDKSHGHWNYQQPICEKMQCPVLPPAITPMHMTCTDRNYYRSTCRFSCDPGYDITPGQTRVTLCTENGSWRGAVPTCKDSEPPKFTKCLGYQVGYTERGSDDGHITTFQFPEVTDNIAKKIQPVLTSKTNPYSRMRRGVYMISYDAVDTAGNKASGCRIKLVIKTITCPRIYPTADSFVTCTAGSRHGSNCEFACSSSAVLNGTKYITCERHNLDAYGYWTWQDQQPFCQDAKRCREKLRAPDNGAIACDYWLGGSFCHMFCQHEYDVPRGERIDVNGMFVCGQSGKWNPSASVPNCAKVSKARSHHYRLNVDFQFTGNCHDSDVVMEIQQKFIDTWKTSGFKEGCLHEIDKCIPSNIQVRCGGLTGKRSTSLSISFYIQIDAPLDVEGEIFSNLTQQQYNAVQRLKKAIHNGRISIDLDNNSTLHATELTYYTLETECDGGTVLTQNRQGCVKCVPGTFYQRHDKTCISCPRGTYQPDEGHFTCRICPNGTSTRIKGSTDISNCEVACSPGSWSADGIPPCSYCPKGTYQDIYGGNECEICPNSTTTELDGATDVKHCIEFDAFISSTNASFSKHFFTTSKANIISKIWISIEKTQTKNSLIELKIDGVQNIKLSLKDNHIALAYNGTVKFTSAKLLMKKWYPFVLKISETELLVNIEGESITINHRISLKKQHGKITVGRGFTGRISQLNIFDKDTEVFPFQSCLNNAMGNVLSWKDFEELVAPDIFIDVPSDCDDTNECDAYPCLNGNCTDELNGFSCQCFYGFYGDNCENNIDDCDDNACDNNGTCIDGAASYDCDCQPGYAGNLCEIKIVDGEWGEWGNWSSCSVTCGNGTMTRMRYCNSPTPDNGGSYCIGNNTEYDTCMDEECLVCNQLFEPENTFLFCDNDTVTDTINCTLSCNPGFAFDHDPKDFYLCGPDTLHQWDIQTVENPLARLPSCTELKNASTLKIRYTASYSNLICDLSASSDDASSVIKNVVNSASQKIECILNGTCKISVVKITNCTEQSRKKRELSNEVAGFIIEYECDSKKYGSEKCHHMLLHAFESMVEQTSEKLLDSEIESVVYPIDFNSLSVEDTVVCEAGMVPVDYRCVPCSKGRYEDNGNCNLCDVGSYQDKTGSQRCHKCPDGRSTFGMGSTNAEDCSVKKEMMKDVVNGMVIGLVCFFGLLLLSVVGFTLRRTLRKSPKIIDNTFNGAKTAGFKA